MSKKGIQKFWVLVVISVFIASLIGCSALKNTKTTGSSSSKTQSKNKVAPVYYDFSDVLVPGELKIVKKSTLVVQSSDYISGILTLRGRVDANSLLNFFQNYMVSDNWTLISYMKSPMMTIVLFHKVGRWCTIIINESDYYTYVQIGVAPTVGAGEEAFN